MEFTVVEQELIGKFLTCIRELPEVRAKLDRTKGRRHLNPDYGSEIDLRIGDQSVSLLIEVKKAVYPRDVRQQIWQYRQWSQRTKRGQDYPAQLLLIAESISPGAKELLRAERVGYFDSGGSLFLPARNIYLDIDKPPPKSQQRAMRSIFSGRRAQIMHALMMHHRDWFGVKELSALARASPSSTSEVLSELERVGWLASRGKGPNKERQLQEPTALLDEWVKQLSSLRNPIVHRYYVPSLAIEALIERIDQVFYARQIRYAISYEAAAQRYAPFLSSVSQVRSRVRLTPEVDVAIAEFGARRVDEGSNFAIVETESASELLFSEKVDGIWLASPIQVYLDLLRGEGRAKEMAEHLRKERIGF